MSTYTLSRDNPTTHGLAIRDTNGKPLLVDGCAAVGITRWEGRQVMGWMGLA